MLKRKLVSSHILHTTFVSGFCCKHNQSFAMALRRSARTKAAEAATSTELKPSSTSASEPAKSSRKRANVTDTEGVNGAKKVKTSKTKTTEDNSQDGFKVPSTPTRRTKKTVQPPPITPTPSIIKLIAPYSSGDIDGSTPPPLDRPVEPHLTTATLLTPNGTQLTAYPNLIPDSSPSKTGLPRPTATTGTLLEQAVNHLQEADPRLIPLTSKHHCHIFSPAGLAEEIDPFRSLASGIIAQQVSGAAAKSIKNKFVALFEENKSSDGTITFPTPKQVVAADFTKLRTAGLSQRKAEYIQGLAEKFTSGELSTEMLLKATDEEVMEKLIAVRGLGRWSVEMFACFGLKRMDIFSTGDLGVQRGMAAFVGRDVKKLKGKGGKWKYMTEKEMEEMAEQFRPYRSLFMWYMWRVEDVDIEAVENA